MQPLATAGNIACADPVSMPAQGMPSSAIFLAPPWEANLKLLQPSGRDEEPAAILLCGTRRL